MSSYSSKRAAFVVALIFFAGVAVANLPVARIASAAASFLTVVAHDASLAGEGTNTSPLTIAGNGVGTNHLANNSVTSAKIPAGQVVKKINGLTDDIFLVAGSNISIGQTGNTLTIESLLALTSVSHDSSLIGDGTAATPLGIANAGVGTLQLADASVNSSKIASGEIVKGVNGLKDNITLAAGANITITPNGNILTVASTAGGSPSTTPYINPLQVATLHWRRHHQIGIQLTLGQPTGPIAFDGANMWVPLTDGTVAKIRAHDLKILATYSLPGIGAGMAYDGVHMWIAISDSNLVVRMRISDGVIVNQITVSPNPRQVMFDGHIIWVAGLTDVTQIVLGQNHGSPYAYNAPPTGLAVDGVFRWATLTNNTVVKFFSDQDAIATINVGNNPQALAFDGAHMWIANAGSNSVTKIRVSDNAVLGSFNIGSGPSSLAFDGDNMWVANWGTNSLVRFRTSDGAILHTYHQLGTNIRNLAFDGVSIWVTHATGVTKLS
jgi:hypothetical protein